MPINAPGCRSRQAAVAVTSIAKLGHRVAHAIGGAPDAVAPLDRRIAALVGVHDRARHRYEARRGIAGVRRAHRRLYVALLSTHAWQKERKPRKALAHRR